MNALCKLRPVQRENSNKLVKFRGSYEINLFNYLICTLYYLESFNLFVHGVGPNIYCIYYY